MTAPYTPPLDRLRIVLQDIRNQSRAGQAQRLLSGPPALRWQPGRDVARVVEYEALSWGRRSLPWPGILSCSQPWLIRARQRSASSARHSLDLPIVPSGDAPSPFLDSSRRDPLEPQVWARQVSLKVRPTLATTSDWSLDFTPGAPGCGQGSPLSRNITFPSSLRSEIEPSNSRGPLLGNGFSVTLSSVVQCAIRATIGGNLALRGLSHVLAADWPAACDGEAAVTTKVPCP